MPRYKFKPFDAAAVASRFPEPLRKPGGMALQALSDLFGAEDPTSIIPTPALGMAAARFPAKVPNLPTGFNLMDEVWGQVEKLRTGAGDMARIGRLSDLLDEDVNKLADQYTDISGHPNQYVYRTRNVVPPKHHNRALLALREAIDKGPHRLVQEDNHTLEQIMRFLAD